MRCVACRSDAPTVTEAEIAELHPQVSEWEIVEQDGVKKLTRVFRFDDFAKALAFTTARLVDEGVRMVFVNGALNSLSVPSVAVDEVFAGERATQHLLELEHTRIGRTGLLSPHAGEGSRTRAGPTSRGARARFRRLVGWVVRRLFRPRAQASSRVRRSGTSLFSR